MIAELARRAAAEIGEDASPLDYVVNWIENGDTITALAESVGNAIGEPIARMMLSNYLNNQEDAEQRLSAARVRGAHAMVEQSRSIVDAPLETREEIAAAKLRSDVRLWAAERYNRPELGTRDAASVTVNVNVLHMDALRTRVVATVEQPALPSAEPGPSAIAGAIADDDDDVTDYMPSI